ncbi:MAG: CDP-alcohol phosphatidyltransferase family protein [Anaerolineaceae bacterium]|nr:CDP-alcohol phosphatidyltransferase family protein [Anaerolineaceae bacterium]
MEHVVTKERESFTDKMRKIFKGMFEPIARFLLKIGIKPNTVTFSGLVGHAVAAYFAAQGQMSIAGIILLVMAPVDYLDGMMARLRGESTRFGSFVDSVTDRYSEFVILGGLLYYYVIQENWLVCLLVYLAATGSVLVSYVRNRAELIGYEAKNGILSRMERYLVLIPGLIFNWPIIALWILAIFTQITALQRIIHVRQQAHRDKEV